MDLWVYHALNGLAGHGVWPDRSLRRIATYLPVAFGLVLTGVWFWPAAAALREERQRLVVYAVAAAVIFNGI
jgi:hypothetical protein